MGSSRIPHMYLTLAWPYMGCPWPWHHSTPYVSALLPTAVFQQFLHLGDHWSTAIFYDICTTLGTWRLQLSSAIWAALWLVSCIVDLLDVISQLLAIGFPLLIRLELVVTVCALGLLRVYCPVQHVFLGPAPAVVAVALVLLGDRCCWIQAFFLGSILVVIFSTCD